MWLFGEYPEEHEGNKVSAPSTWLAGIQEAAAGILMRVDPKLNTSQYKQGEAPAVEFLDVAKVFAVTSSITVPTGTYDGVLVVDEHDPNQQPQDGHQFKYHAPGVGIVQVTARGGDGAGDAGATEHRKLTPEELAAANARALELDQRAYNLAKPVYGAHRAGSPPLRNPDAGYAAGLPAPEVPHTADRGAPGRGAAGGCPTGAQPCNWRGSAALTELRTDT